ncbi:hypothetical protein L5F43_07750 [Aliarcobacter butzleri]|uniref:pyocin knob domain-containing protein n=1 Tax=Aliarcobacter butzleri TaxID=28197 RepID=UPI001EDC5945|nr:pyocin knob domain-containing protein [Aliarcobacter butzleri]MCG3706376.1 hypothetical protein [Aliarcobacter butzleri]
MVSKITATIESVPIWGYDNFDANVHENFLKLKELGPQLNKTVDEINKTVEDIDTYTKTASNKAGEAAQSASTANSAKQTATQQAEIATTKAGEVNDIKNEMIEVIEALQSDPLSIIASEELAKKLNISDTQDLLTSTDSTKPLSANQGRILKGFIDAINGILSSDDTTLDELQEIVSFIKQNKSTLDNLSISNIAGLSTSLNNKVDKVNGKGLSSNDFTTTEKNKLANIEAGAQVNVNPTWNTVANKPEFNEKGFAFLKGFALNGAIERHDVDVNTILFNSTYSVITNSPNLPTVGTSYIVDTRIFSYSGTSYATQTAMSVDVETKFFYRHRDNGVWKAWKEL